MFNQSKVFMILDGKQIFATPADKIIDADNLMGLIQKPFAKVAPDKSSSAANDDSHKLQLENCKTDHRRKIFADFAHYFIVSSPP